MDPFLCLGCFLLLAGFVLDIISVASREWVVSSGGGTSGLWERCSTNMGPCVPLTREDYLDAARAMMVLSVIVSGITLLIVIVDIASIWINNHTNPWILRTGAALTLLSALLSLAGILVSQKIEWGIGSTNYGYSYWLGVATIILFFVAGIFFVAAAIRYHRLQKQLEKQAKERLVKKDYPFIIPYYNYMSDKEQSKEQESTMSESKQARKPGVSPFLYDYKYYATTHLPSRMIGNDVSDVRSNGYSSGYFTAQLPGPTSLAVRNSTVDNYQSSIYSKSQQARKLPAVANANAISAGTSVITSPGIHSRSNASSRRPRDSCGFPLDYSREL